MMMIPAPSTSTKKKLSLPKFSPFIQKGARASLIGRKKSVAEDRKKEQLTNLLNIDDVHNRVLA